jgi:hypothetical protein
MLFWLPQSDRNAVTGSTRDARRAGSQLAANAHAPRMTTIAM